MTSFEPDNSLLIGRIDTNNEEVEDGESSTPGTEELPIKAKINNPSRCAEYIYNIIQTTEVIPGPGARNDTIAGILVGVLPKLSSEQTDYLEKARKYALEQSIKMVSMKKTHAHQEIKNKTFQRYQVLALMCRVYIGSISFELKEHAIRASFLPFGPIKSINMSWDPSTRKHKGFAFVEYEIPEAAQLAFEQMNGVKLGGRNIKVVIRPSNMPQAQSVIDEIQEEAKNYNRVYVASIHPDLSADDLKSVFEAFGRIINCNLPLVSSASKNKGYGFIEYETEEAAKDAIASMNLFDLGGQYLRVGRAITPRNALSGPSSSLSIMPTAAALAAAAATAKIQAMDAVEGNAAPQDTSKHATSIETTVPQTLPGCIPPPGVAIPQLIQPVYNIQKSKPDVATPILPTITPQHEVMKRVQEAQLKHQEELEKKLLVQNEPQTLQQQENMSIKGPNARHLVMQKLMRKVDTRVVILQNMVGPEDVDESLQEEIQEECSKFGNVDRVVIYNEKQTEEDDDNIIVKIFVEFSETKGAQCAREALDGRHFGGRMVRASLYGQILFDQNDFSG